MRLSDRNISERLKRLERQSSSTRERLEALSLINVTDHIAPVYVPLHNDIISEDHEFYNLPGGRGSCKSSFVSLELVNGIMQDQTGQSNALVVRKWAVTLRGSVYSQIQWAINTLGVGSRWRSTLTPLQFIYETGQVIRFTGLDNPTKLKSVKPNKGYFKYLWMEEFSEINGEAEMRNLQQSVLRGGKNYIVFRSFNPPMSKSNWVNAFVSIPDQRAVTLLTNYTQVPPEWLGEQFLEEALRLKEINPQAYDNEYMGIACGSGGAVFPNVEVREITDQEVREAEYIFCGLDWGFAVDPACFLRVSYDRKKETILILNEIYQTGLSNKKLADLIKEKGFQSGGMEKGYSYMMGGYYETQREQRIYADCSEPKSIADMREHGLKVLPCHKEPGCVEYRVKWLQHRKIIVDPGRTPNAYRELTNYEYSQDRQGNFVSTLPDKDNHSIDALAYALDKQIYLRKNSA